LIFPTECRGATTFDWEWGPSTLQRLGKAGQRERDRRHFLQDVGMVPADGVFPGDLLVI